MIFTWLRNRRRKKILASPMPDDWKAILDQNVSQLSRLTVKRDLLTVEFHWSRLMSKTLTKPSR